MNPISFTTDEMLRYKDVASEDLNSPKFFARDDITLILPSLGY